MTPLPPVMTWPPCAANARLREANARLRQVVEAKDTELAAPRAALEAGQARQAEVIRRLELRVAELASMIQGVGEAGY